MSREAGTILLSLVVLLVMFDMGANSNEQRHQYAATGQQTQQPAKVQEAPPTALPHAEQPKEELIVDVGAASVAAKCQSAECSAAYEAFLTSGTNSAFAIGTNGVWATGQTESQVAMAEAEALTVCVGSGGENCHIVSSNRVLDR